MASRCSRGDSSAAGLAPGLARGHEQHLRQAEGLVRLLGEDEVAQVGRVEGAAQDTDSHPGHSTSTSPMRTRSPGLAPARLMALTTPQRPRRRQNSCRASSCSSGIISANASTR